MCVRVRLRWTNRQIFRERGYWFRLDSSKVRRGNNNLQRDLNPRLSACGNVFNSSLSLCPLFNIYRKESCNTHFVVNANINVLSHEYVSFPYCLFMHLFIHFSRLWICRDLVAGVALWENCTDRYTAYVCTFAALQREGILPRFCPWTMRTCWG